MAAKIKRAFKVGVLLENLERVCHKNALEFLALLSRGALQTLFQLRVENKLSRNLLLRGCCLAIALRER